MGRSLYLKMNKNSLAMEKTNFQLESADVSLSLVYGLTFTEVLILITTKK
jgi:hypothetical protein